MIPNGIDPTDLQPMADLPRLRARFAAPDEKLVLLVGRLVYEKGFHLALEAMPQLIERVGKVRFLVAGTGTAEAELKAQARALGLEEHGTFIGWTGDEVLHSLYRIADLCLVPSIYEPFGLVALEAMASGCPCIVADTGGLREVVPAGRRVGLRFRARDSRSLARMAEEILADDALRDRLVAQASEHVLRFDWADVARQTARRLRLAARGPLDHGVGRDELPRGDPRAAQRDGMRREPRARPEHRVALRPRPGADHALRADLHGAGERRVLGQLGARADPQEPAAGVHAGAVADRHAVAHEQERPGLGAQDHVAADPHARAEPHAPPRPAGAPPAPARRHRRVGSDRPHGGQI